jgi:hypothetical protein
VSIVAEIVQVKNVAHAAASAAAPTEALCSL